MTIRGGYLFDKKRDTRLFNKFSLGLSFRLDDYINISRHARQGNRILKNAALRLDGGFLSSKTFSNVYQGSVTYRPLGPEPFHFIKSDSISLMMLLKNQLFHTRFVIALNSRGKRQMILIYMMK